MSRVLALLSIFATATACASADSPPPEPAAASSTDPAPTEVEPAAEPASDAGIVAEQIDGVWVFRHAPDDAMDALHGGVPTIEGDCLLVDGAAVIWHESKLGEAKAAIEAARAGDATMLSLAGGGMSLGEGSKPEDFPAIVLEHCQVDSVWFGAP